MNPVAKWLVDQQVVSSVRWSLRLIAVLSVTAAVLVPELIERGAPSLVTVLVSMLGAVAALAPDSHLSLFALGLAVWRWVVVADDDLAWWSIIVAVCLIAHHLAIALMAVTPVSVDLPRSITVSWLLRFAAVSTAAAGTWVAVAVFDAVDIGGSAALTAAACAVLVAIAIVALDVHRAGERDDEGSLS